MKQCGGWSQGLSSTKKNIKIKICYQKDRVARGKKRGGAANAAFWKNQWANQFLWKYPTKNSQTLIIKKSKQTNERTERTKTQPTKQTYDFTLNQDHILNFIVHLRKCQQWERTNFKCTLQCDGLTPRRPDERVSALTTSWTRARRQDFPTEHLGS